MRRPCPVCRSSKSDLHGHFRDEEYFTSTDSFAYYRCGECASLYIDPVPVSRLREIYPDNYYSYSPDRAGLLERVKSRLDEVWIRAVLEKLEGDKLRVLDVGGGTGWLLDTVRHVDSRVSDTCIVDLDPRCAERARAKGHSFHVGGIESFSTSDGFDLILMLNIIEHVADPASVLSQTARLLRPGGLVVVKTPNVAAVDATILGSAYWGGLHAPRHWTLFNRRSFHALAARSGLVVVSSKRTQGAPFWTFSALAWLNRRGLISLGPRRPAVSHPLYPLFAAAFAMLDYIRMPFAETSQMFLVLARPAG